MLGCMDPSYSHIYTYYTLFPTMQYVHAAHNLRVHAPCARIPLQHAQHVVNCCMDVHTVNAQIHSSPSYVHLLQQHSSKVYIHFTTISIMRLNNSCIYTVDV